MWKAVVLAVCLLVAGVQPMGVPTYGVKLCGREFIRAVIFTCGGSRWKRSIMSAGERLKVWSLIAIATSQAFNFCPCIWYDLVTKSCMRSLFLPVVYLILWQLCVYLYHCKIKFTLCYFMVLIVSLLSCTHLCLCLIVLCFPLWREKSMLTC